MGDQVINSLSADGPVSMETSREALLSAETLARQERDKLLLSKHDLLICRIFLRFHLTVVQTQGNPEQSETRRQAME